MAYLLDANVFIEAQNTYYSFDVCPAFWEWLTAANAAGLLYSIEAVYDELRKQEDALAQWAAQRGPAFFLPPDDAHQNALATVAQWATGQQYRPAAVHKFLGGADYYLVAYALAHGHVVVTREASASQSLKSIKIPDACAALSVTCTTPFSMLQQAGVRFILMT